MDGNDPYAAKRRRLTGPLLLLLAAFLLGIALTVIAVRRWDRIALLLHPEPVATPLVTKPTPPSFVAPPPAAAQVPDAILTQRVGAIEGRLDAIDARAAAASGNATRAEGLLVTFAARRALDSGQPLGYLEGLLRDRFGGGDAPAVAQVIAAAQRPVTLAALQDGLAALGPALTATGPEQGWWSATRRELSGLFVVRRADKPSPASADRMTRASRALEQGQVDAAAAEVARMPGSAAAGAWLAAARRYTMARNALDRLETAALLAPPASPSGRPVAGD